jgi:hypothetical protein
MSFKEKYLKYKSKYLQLKKTLGGARFYLSLYVFSRAPLTEIVKTHISSDLSEKYGGDITIRTSSYGLGLMDDMAWFSIRSFIEGKSKHTEYYKELVNITQFQIIQIPEILQTPPMNDAKLTTEEHKIGSFRFDELSFNHPIMHESDDPSHRGWGLWSGGMALIALVESP